MHHDFGPLPRWAGGHVENNVPKCTYCEAPIEWLEISQGQRIPFDPPPAPVLGKTPPWPPPNRTFDQYVLVRGLAVRATAEDKKLLRPIFVRHRCKEYVKR